MAAGTADAHGWDVTPPRPGYLVGQEARALGEGLASLELARRRRASARRILCHRGHATLGVTPDGALLVEIRAALRQALAQARPAPRFDTLPLGGGHYAGCWLHDPFRDRGPGEGDVDAEPLFGPEPQITERYLVMYGELRQYLPDGTVRTLADPGQRLERACVRALGAQDVALLDAMFNTSFTPPRLTPDGRLATAASRSRWAQGRRDKACARLHRGPFLPTPQPDLPRFCLACARGVPDTI